MRMRGLKLMGMLALAVGVGALAGGNVSASCDPAVDPDYFIVQGGQADNSSWFAAPPAGSGAVSGAWWQVGFGNGNVVKPGTADAIFGGALIPQTGTTGTGNFIGNDSGILPIEDPTGNPSMDLGLCSACPGSGLPGPPVGSRCFCFSANWTNNGSDGCVDNNRDGGGPGGTLNASDNKLNPYAYYSGEPDNVANRPEEYVTQVDAPMGVLLKETNNLNFALAFFASRPRPGRFIDDPTPGNWDVRNIVNGVQNTNNGQAAKNNVIPWQPVPQLNATNVGFVNNDTSMDRIITLQWAGVKVVHDGTTRPNPILAGDATTNPLGGAAGAGVLDQGPLARYVVEVAPISSPGPPVVCGAYAAHANGSVPHSGDGALHQVTLQVPRDRCLRVTTQLGRAPQANLVTGQITNNRLNAQRGMLGDLGYSVSSRDLVVGGALISETALLRRAEKARSDYVVDFDTTSELTVTGFDIVGKDVKGAERILKSVNCTQCNTGQGATYSTSISTAEMKGSKRIQVITQPSGARSNELPLKE